MRGGDAPANDGLFDAGGRDQFDMFADTGRVSDGAANDMFGDPSPTAPEVKGQISAAENAIREALARGEDFDLPTGRLIDGWLASVVLLGVGVVCWFRWRPGNSNSLPKAGGP